MHKGDSNEKDWQLILKWQPSKVEHLTQFQDATTLYFGNEEVANYNFDKLARLNQPIACIKAHPSSDLARKLGSDERSGLEPVIFLAKGANVVLTMNLWNAAGLCNGATGTVKDFIYEKTKKPPSLSIAVVVQFDNYRGPSIIDGLPKCVPISPITVTCNTPEGIQERQQLPLKLAWAMTIHKSQGLTLPMAWIDIGKTERTAGISYVAINRVKTLSCCIIEPMPLKNLHLFKKSSL